MIVAGGLISETTLGGLCVSAVNFFNRRGAEVGRELGGFVF